MFDVSEIIIETAVEQEKIDQKAKQNLNEIRQLLLTEGEFDEEKCLKFDKELIDARIDTTINLITNIRNCALNEKAFNGSNFDAVMTVAFRRVIEDFKLLNILIHARGVSKDLELENGSNPLSTKKFFKLLQDGFDKEFRIAVEIYDEIPYPDENNGTDQI